MVEEYYPSKYLAEAVEQFMKLPGVGEKTALRHVLHLLKLDDEQVKQFAEAILNLKTKTHKCKICHNISDSEVCSICSDESRDHTVVCVVEDVQDLLAIERTQQYRGVYHVLDGLINPIEGIGPQDINVDTLVERVKEGGIEEVILALNTTTEGEATAIYIYKKLKPYGVKISTIARGVGFGDELHYTDEFTLGQAIMQRMPFEKL